MTEGQVATEGMTDAVVETVTAVEEAVVEEGTGEIN